MSKNQHQSDPNAGVDTASEDQNAVSATAAEGQSTSTESIVVSVQKDATNSSSLPLNLEQSLASLKLAAEPTETTVAVDTYEPMLTFLRVGGSAVVYNFLNALAIRVTANNGEVSKQRVAKMLQCCDCYRNSFNIIHTVENFRQVTVQASALASGDLMEILEEPERFKPGVIGYQQVEQLLRAVLTMHQQGFIHGDLKPENILFHLDNDNKIELLQLCDFGDLQEVSAISTQVNAHQEYRTHLSPDVWLLKGYRDKFELNLDSEQQISKEDETMIIAQKMLNELWALGRIIADILAPITAEHEQNKVKDLGKSLYSWRFYHPKDAEIDLTRKLTRLIPLLASQDNEHKSNMPRISGQASSSQGGTEVSPQNLLDLLCQQSVIPEHQQQSLTRMKSVTNLLKKNKQIIIAQFRDPNNTLQQQIIGNLKNYLEWIKEALTQASDSSSTHAAKQQSNTTLMSQEPRGGGEVSSASLPRDASAVQTCHEASSRASSEKDENSFPNKQKPSAKNTTKPG